MTCIAIDDEPLALQITEAFVKQIPDLYLVRTFTDALAAREYLLSYPVDLLFLDIQMPDISGIDFYKSLPQNCMVIFTTAYSEYAVEGFNLSAIDYLLKPFEFSRFQQAVEKAQDYMRFNQQRSTEHNAFMYIRADYSLIKLHFEDIEYIEGLDDYIRIFMKDRKPIMTLMSLKNMAEKLPSHSFMRVHRSYIVPLSKIQGVRNKRIQLSNTEVPIGGSYEERFWTFYKK